MIRGPIARSLARPYRVTAPMVLLVSLVPLYLFLPVLFPPRARYAPAIALDRALPLVPTWSLVYGALYGFLILLPIFLVRTDAHIRRTVFAYLFIWITAYVFFAVYPTAAPRPSQVIGEGFGAWGLRALYSADPPYNCFPSLHVAHSFVSAWTCVRVHRRVGSLAIACAAIVALSTLFTKQHYILDVVAGVVLALLACGMFLRERNEVPELDRQAAPAFAACLLAAVALGVGVCWIAFRWSGETQFVFGP